MGTVFALPGPPPGPITLSETGLVRCGGPRRRVPVLLAVAAALLSASKR